MTYFKNNDGEINYWKVGFVLFAIALTIYGGFGLVDHYKALKGKADKVDGLQIQINYIGSSYCRFVETATQGQIKCEMKDGQVTLP